MEFPSRTVVFHGICWYFPCVARRAPQDAAGAPTEESSLASEADDLQWKKSLTLHVCHRTADQLGVVWGVNGAASMAVPWSVWEWISFNIQPSLAATQRGKHLAALDMNVTSVITSGLEPFGGIQNRLRKVNRGQSSFLKGNPAVRQMCCLIDSPCVAN